MIVAGFLYLSGQAVASKSDRVRDVAAEICRFRYASVVGRDVDIRDIDSGTRYGSRALQACHHVLHCSRHISPFQIADLKLAAIALSRESRIRVALCD